MVKGAMQGEIGSYLSFIELTKLIPYSTYASNFTNVFDLLAADMYSDPGGIQ